MVSDDRLEFTIALRPFRQLLERHHCRLPVVLAFQYPHLTARLCWLDLQNSHLRSSGTISSFCEAIKSDNPTSSFAASSFSLSAAVSSSTDTNVNDSAPSLQSFCNLSYLRSFSSQAFGKRSKPRAACSTVPMNR